MFPYTHETPRSTTTNPTRHSSSVWLLASVRWIVGQRDVLLQRWRLHDLCFQVGGICSFRRVVGGWKYQGRVLFFSDRINVYGTCYLHMALPCGRWLKPWHCFCQSHGLDVRVSHGKNTASNLEIQSCPILRRWLLVLGVKLPQKLGHLTCQECVENIPGSRKHIQGNGNWEISPPESMVFPDVFPTESYGILPAKNPEPCYGNTRPLQTWYP